MPSCSLPFSLVPDSEAIPLHKIIGCCGGRGYGGQGRGGQEQGHGSQGGHGQGGSPNNARDDAAAAASNNPVVYVENQAI
jgi:hypothetical protein